MTNDKGELLLAYLAEHGVDVEPRSGWQKLRCPFHGDRHASAGVNVDLGRFRCFGCDLAGDVYDLIRAETGCGFREAQRRAQALGSSRHGHPITGSPRPRAGTTAPKKPYIPPRLRKTTKEKEQ
jgi:hypothetical protein